MESDIERGSWCVRELQAESGCEIHDRAVYGHVE